MVTQKILKSAKIFSLEIFRLYGTVQLEVLMNLINFWQRQYLINSSNFY